MTRYTRTVTGKKGMHSISILLIFIAVTVIALGLSSYFIIISDKLIGKGITTKQEIERSQPRIQIVSVTGMDVTDGIVDSLMIDIKMLHSDGTVGFEDMTVSLGEPEYRSLLRYREGGLLEKGNEGYQTFSPQTLEQLQNAEYYLPFTDDTITPSTAYPLPVDLDGDGTNDSLYTCTAGGSCPPAYAGTHLRVELSGNGQNEYIELRDDTTGALINLSNNPQTLNITRAPITGDYGYITLKGTTNDADIGWGGENVWIYTAIASLESDLDEDGQADYLYLNRTHVIVVVSSEQEDITIPLGGLLNQTPLTLNINERILSSTGTNYGRVTITGTTTTDDELDQGVTFTLTPSNQGKGYFTVEHLIRSQDSLNGRLVPGDVVRIYIDTYDELINDKVFFVGVQYKHMELGEKHLYVGNILPNTKYHQIFPNV